MPTFRLLARWVRVSLHNGRSHGTLGFLVGAELQIVPAKAYVRVQYTPLATRKAGVEVGDVFFWVWPTSAGARSGSQLTGRTSPTNVPSQPHRYFNVSRLVWKRFSKTTMILSSRSCSPATRWSS
jgi:hypothetical protein